MGGHKFSLHFLLTEWEQVVDAWQLDNWEAYRDVARLGSKTRLPEAQRAVLWSIFERVRAGLKERKLITHAGMFTALAAAIAKSKNLPFDFAVVDEAQDISVAHLRFFAALGGDRPNALFFAGDLGQRIFQQPFSWKSLGVDIRGRSRTLRVNYRTSHQIRTQADRLLGPVVTDVDGNTRGPERHRLRVQRPAADNPRRSRAKARRSRRSATGLPNRPRPACCRTSSACSSDPQRNWTAREPPSRRAGLAFKILDEHVETTSGHVSISTMHLAKGLEFRAVVVMACDDEIIPLQERIETVGDDADLAGSL